MSEWVLILTVVAGTYSAPAMTQAGPFQSRELCMKAGGFWLREITAQSQTRSAVCVQSRVSAGEKP